MGFDKLYERIDEVGRRANSSPKNASRDYPSRTQRELFDKFLSGRDDDLSLFGGNTDSFYKDFATFLRLNNYGDREIQRLLVLHDQFLSAHNYHLVPEHTKVTPRPEPESAKPEKSWAKQVRPDRTPELMALPETAPALWKRDKQPGDTPPDFIKRHYRPWLRADATGLTRPDIHRLDPHLYKALTNWLWKNELPSDCPLPKRSEVTDAVARSRSTDQSIPSDKIEQILRANRALRVRGYRAKEGKSD